MPDGYFLTPDDYAAVQDLIDTRIARSRLHPTPLRRPRRGAGSSGDQYQIVRGVTVTAVLNTDPTFQLTSLTMLETGSIKPDDTITVINISQSARSAGALAYAVAVDGSNPQTWEDLNFAAQPPIPPVRLFQLQQDQKTLNDHSCQGVFLKADGTIDGGFSAPLITFYEPDPQQNIFSGRGNIYIRGENAFTGIAEQHQDEDGTLRWIIVNMQGFLPIITGQLVRRSNYPAQGTNLKIQYTGPGTNPNNGALLGGYQVAGWGCRQPAIPDFVQGAPSVDSLLLYAPANENERWEFDKATPYEFGGISYGPTASFALYDPDTAAPTYTLLSSPDTLREGTLVTPLTKRSDITGGVTQPGGGVSPTVVTWGSGNVQLWNEDGSNDGAPISIINKKNVAGVIGADVTVDTGYDPPRLVSLTCGA